MQRCWDTQDTVEDEACCCCRSVFRPVARLRRHDVARHEARSKARVIAAIARAYSQAASSAYVVQIARASRLQHTLSRRHVL